jgi:hypothetical protein
MKKWLKPQVTTDLLLGITSIAPDKKHHYFLCDIDNNNVNEIMEKIGTFLIEKRKFGTVYLIRSGKGYHILSFSRLLAITEYTEILEEIGADPKFIEWVKKVKYGVLRLSRRSSHKQVPKLEKVLKSPYNSSEDEVTRDMYFMALNLEKGINNIIKVEVKR